MHYVTDNVIGCSKIYCPLCPVAAQDPGNTNDQQLTIYVGIVHVLYMYRNA